MIREYIVKISDEIMEEEITDRPQELVRCEHCQHSWYDPEIDAYRCEHPFGLTGMPHTADWFCADGEPKEGGECGA